MCGLWFCGFGLLCLKLKALKPSGLQGLHGSGFAIRAFVFEAYGKASPIEMVFSVFRVYERF